MTHKLPADGFKQVEETSQFNEHFIKNYNEVRSIGYLTKVDV